MAVRFDSALADPYDLMDGPCSGRAQPGLIELASWTIGTYGGTNLGIYNCRPVRNGKGWSIHASGRAFDWRAPSRATLEAYFDVLVGNADALRIQGIHDYDRSLRWETGRGWYKARIGGGAGRWTTHVERNWDGALDERPIVDILGASAGDTPPLEQEDLMPDVIEQPGRTKDPVRPAYAAFWVAQHQITLFNGASLGGDADTPFGVRIVDLKPYNPQLVPWDGWQPLTAAEAEQILGAPGLAPWGGIRVVDRQGRGYLFWWS